MQLAEILKVIFLGIVEGITEWLPISSTGHMLLVDEFLHLNMSDSFKEMFFVVIQLGAIAAVVLLFWNKMFPFGFKKGFEVKTDIFATWFKVAVACLPAAIGFFVDDYIEEHLGTPVVIALMLIIYGVLFIVVENRAKNRLHRIKSMREIDFGTAFMIGIFQTLAFIPGTSRSGATIIGALIIGVSRMAAAEFTFFLAVPTMLFSSAYKLLKFGLAFTGAEIAALLLGMVTAFVVSLFAISFLMSYIKKHDFKLFGCYRIVLGAVVLLYFLALKPLVFA